MELANNGMVSPPTGNEISGNLQAMAPSLHQQRMHHKGSSKLFGHQCIYMERNISELAYNGAISAPTGKETSVNKHIMDQCTNIERNTLELAYNGAISAQTGKETSGN